MERGEQGGDRKQKDGQDQDEPACTDVLHWRNVLRDGEAFSVNMRRRDSVGVQKRFHDIHQRARTANKVIEIASARLR